MSQSLRRFNLTDAFDNTTNKSWIVSLPYNSIGANTFFNNVSDTEFNLYGDSGTFITLLPAGAIFWPIYFSAPTSFVEFRPVSLVITATLPNYVSGIQFSVKEPRPQISPSVITRNIGGTVSVSTSDAIIATGQADGITTNFETGPGLPVSATDLIDIRPTVNDTAKSHGMAIDSYDGSVYNHELTAYLGVSIYGANGLRVPNGPTSLNGGAVTALNGEPLTGMGVPVTPAAPLLTLITVLTAVNVVDFTPLHNGFYLVCPSFILANGTPGNMITVKVTYRNAAGLFVSNFKFINNAVEAMANGATNFANGSWAGEPLGFYATTAGHIQVSYQDPTNTPNDSVSVVLLRLA